MRLYRRLLRLYPPTFLTRFEDEMLQVIHDYKLLDGRVPWTRVYGDLMTSAVVQRLKEMSDMRTKIGVLLFLVVAVGGGTMMVTGVSFGRSWVVMTLLALFAIGLIFAVSTLVANRGGKGAEYQYTRRKLRWWWVPAGLVGAFQVLFMLGQLIDDPKKENLFGVAVIAAFSAIVFVGMAVRNRIAGNWMIATGVLPMLPFFWIVIPTMLALLVIVMALADNIRMSSPHPAV